MFHQPIYFIKTPVFCREKRQWKNSSCPTVASEQRRDAAVPGCLEGTLFCRDCFAALNGREASSPLLTTPDFVPACVSHP